MAKLTYRFRLFRISFESVGKDIPGLNILDALSGFTDTDSADFEVSDWSLVITAVTSDTDESILKKCDEVKKLLERTFDSRLIYKIEAISF